jgi:hypothetical protein
VFFFWPNFFCQVGEKDVGCFPPTHPSSKHSIRSADLHLLIGRFVAAFYPLHSAMQTREVTEILTVLERRISKLEGKVTKLEMGFEDLSERGYDSLRSGEDTGYTDRVDFSSFADMSDLLGKVVYTRYNLLCTMSQSQSQPPIPYAILTLLIDLSPIHTYIHT